MRGSVTIRSARIQDAEALSALIHQLAEYERLSDVCKITPACLAERLFCDRPQAECIVAEDNSELIGMAIFFTTFSTFTGKHGIYLEDLFVKEDRRGEGTGKSLLLKLVQIAKERNCGRVEWAVLNWNASAIGFYQKLGARPMDTWTVYRLDNEHIEELSRPRSSETDSEQA